jgi:crotonobetaine/carnitine-CoA ligase
MDGAVDRLMLGTGIIAAMSMIEDAPPWGRSEETVSRQLARRAAERPDFVYCRFGGETLTLGELDRRVNRFANGLRALGLKPGDRVPVMLPNHPDYTVAFFALQRLGICQVPVNVHLRGAGLDYLIEHSQPRAVIVDARYAEPIAPALRRIPVETVIWRGGAGDGGAARRVDFADVASHPDASPAPDGSAADATAVIMYTSGTTGMPKGVQLTDKMVRVCARAAELVGDIRAGDRLFLWEPLYHIGGTEVMALAAMEPISLAMVERFSVSQFWDQVRREGATHIHFFGGVLALLLKEPNRPDDRVHKVRIAWGGGCPLAVWEKFQDRFGVRIRECYGMTEASSFTTVNTDEKVGSVGKALPWFEVRIVDDAGRFLGPGERGEIWVREKVPGLLLKEYFRNPEATDEALQGGWLRTGDVGYVDADGFFFYAGRKKDSVRRRGENVAAFEIERIVGEHPDIAESAVIGVANEIADQDIKIFLRVKPGSRLDPLDFIRWCETRMAYFQVPRYVAVIDELPKGPTERTRKELLSRDTTGCFDLEKSGYRLARR